jgi:hypothetical protein
VIASLVLSVIAAAQPVVGPGQLDVWGLLVRIPEGCHGKVVESIDAILGDITCDDGLSIDIFGDGVSDPCHPTDVRTARKAAPRFSAHFLTTEGIAVSTCEAEWWPGERRRLAVSVSGVTFYARVRTPAQTARYLEIVSSFRGAAK